MLVFSGFCDKFQHLAFFGFFLLVALALFLKKHLAPGNKYQPSLNLSTRDAGGSRHSLERFFYFFVLIINQIWGLIYTFDLKI